MTCHFGLSIAADIFLVKTSCRNKYSRYQPLSKRKLRFSFKESLVPRVRNKQCSFMFKTKPSVGITQESRLNDIVAKLALES